MKSQREARYSRSKGQIYHVLFLKKPSVFNLVGLPWLPQAHKFLGFLFVCSVKMCFTFRSWIMSLFLIFHFGIGFKICVYSYDEHFNNIQKCNKNFHNSGLKLGQASLLYFLFSNQK